MSLNSSRTPPSSSATSLPRAWSGESLIGLVAALMSGGSPVAEAEQTS
jgi:hypothetical protein